MHMIRTTVIFINYGPYHVAWARSLAGVDDIDPHFIELASEQKKYPWQIERDTIDLNFKTLVWDSYEQTSFWKLYRKLMRTLENLNPEAVVIPSYSPPIMLAAARWAKKHRAASIMIAASTEWDYERVWWKERIKRGLVRRYYDAGFVGGRASRNYLKSLGMPEEYIWGQHDAVDNDYFSNRAEHMLQRKEESSQWAGLPERYFLYVGRFSPEKNLTRLLETYGRYRQSEPGGWGLVLVGDGPQREELLQVVERLDLEDVLWPGFKQITELPLYYALAGAFILPSIREPWGLVVNEAMACGLPVLVSNRCGSAWNLVSEGKNGYTFDPYDVEEMTECMMKLSGSTEGKKLAMSEFSRKIVADYTLEQRSVSLADCIRQTVASTKE